MSHPPTPLSPLSQSGPPSPLSSLSSLSSPCALTRLGTGPPEPPASRARTAPARQGAAAKGRQTHAAILDAALALASQAGLEGLSMGALAALLGMSKSGVFAHFGSREELQIAVIREYHARFEAEVFTPALRVARGLPRLTVLVEAWLRRVTHEIDAGCLYISGAVELDDRPGPVRDALAGMVQAWHGALERAIALAVTEAHLRQDTDAVQLRFEIQALVLSLHHDARFLRTPGSVERARAAFNRLIDSYRPPTRPGVPDAHLHPPAA